MANRLRGEVDFVALDKTWTLRLSMNDLIALQEKLGFGDDDDAFLTQLGQIRGMKRLRTIVHVALAGRQPDITEQQAGDIITEVGFQKVFGLVTESLKWSMPDPEPAGAEGGKASPGATTSTLPPVQD
jgi:hypothetical protein